MEVKTNGDIKKEQTVNTEEEVFYLDDFSYVNSNTKEKIEEKKEIDDADVTFVSIKSTVKATSSSKFNWESVYCVRPKCNHINHVYLKAESKKKRFKIEYNKFNKSIWKHLEINLQVKFFNLKDFF